MTNTNLLCPACGTLVERRFDRLGDESILNTDGSLHHCTPKGTRAGSVDIDMVRSNAADTYVLVDQVMVPFGDTTKALCAEIEHLQSQVDGIPLNLQHLGINYDYSASLRAHDANSYLKPLAFDHGDFSVLWTNAVDTCLPGKERTVDEVFAHLHAALFPTCDRCTKQP